MPVVRETIKDAGGTPVAGAQVTIFLVTNADADGNDSGYVSSTGVTILGRWQVNTDSTGLWQATLVANSLVSPANSYYVAQRFANGSADTDTFIVPNGSGPYDLYTILSASPTPLGTYQSDALPLALAASANAGVGTKVSREDHVHPWTNLATDAELAAHEADTTNIHGISDTSALETQSGAQAKANAAQSAAQSYAAAQDATNLADTTNVHGIADTSLLETTAGSAAKVAAHEADTTAVHGIANTAVLETQSGAQSKADAAQSAAVAAAATDATTKANAAQSAAQTYAAAQDAINLADTTNVHGIADTANLEEGRPYLYLPKGWDTGWKAAQAAQGSALAGVLLLGDSIGIGQGSGATGCSDWWTKSYYNLIRTSLTSRFSSRSDFFSSADSQDFFSTVGGGQGTTSFWTVSSTGRVWVHPAGMTYAPTFTDTGVANKLVFTSPYACTDLDILYWDQSPATNTWTYSVDGGADVTVTNTTAFISRKIQLTGLANSVHTLRFGNQNNGTSNQSSLWIWGVNAYPTNAARTSGVGFARLAHSGYGVLNWLQSYRPTDVVATLQGKQSAATGFGFPSQPALCIIGLGVNDLQATSGIEMFREGLRRMIQSLRRGSPSCSIVLVGYCVPDGTYSDMSLTIANVQSWGLYLGAMRDLAERHTCAFLNIQAKWGSTPQTQGFLGSSNVHPTDAGHQDIANSLLSIL